MMGEMSNASTPATGRPRRPARPGARARMTGKQRREQLLDIGRALFAERGFEGTSVEEIAATAGVSKPVVYEHFGGKEGLYAVVVDREIQTLLDTMTSSLTADVRSRQILEQAALALLEYIETSSDGFRILVRDSPPTSSSGGFASLISDVASQVEYILAGQFTARGFDARTAPLYAQMLVGMVALTGQFWLDHRTINKEEVAAHLVNLAWNGLSGLETKPALGEWLPASPGGADAAGTGTADPPADDPRDEG
jgi:AcrR family transcriptional regulator